MRKLYLFIIISVAIALGISVSPTNAFYDNYATENTQFHPQSPDYYNGNERLELQNRADIERASKPNLHYDKYSGDYYTCSWKRNPNLGTWVCDKEVSQFPEKVDACPYGYIKNPSGICSRINVPENAHLNATGTGWECYGGYKYVGSGCVLNTQTKSVYASSVNNYSTVKKDSYTAYVYYYGDDSDKPTKVTQVGINRPVRLPSTGSGIVWVLLATAIGSLGYVLRGKYSN